MTRFFRFSEERINQLQGIYSDPVREAAVPQLNGLWQEFSQKAAEEHILKWREFTCAGVSWHWQNFFCKGFS
jgi:hypothetical protein